MESYKCLEWVARTLPSRSRRHAYANAIRQASRTTTQCRSITTTRPSRARDDQKSSEHTDTPARPKSSFGLSAGDLAVKDRSPFLPRTPGGIDTVASLLKKFDFSEPTNGPEDISKYLGPRLDASVARPPPPFVPEQAPFKTGPKLGRTVHVEPHKGRDIGRAFNVLRSLVQRNKISHDLARQRFHERGGLKRKRLKSERYRARFKGAFKEMVTRVQEMRKMGW